MNKEAIEQRIKETEEAVEKLTGELTCLKKELREPEKALRLEINIYGSISIRYGDVSLGNIEVNGKCYILCTKLIVAAYEKWREDDMLVDSTPVKWIGGEYSIEYHRMKPFLMRIDTNVRTLIYDFENCSYLSDCNDDNIIRFKHNNKAIGF